MRSVQSLFALRRMPKITQTNLYLKGNLEVNKLLGLPEATTGLYLNQITSGKPEIDIHEIFLKIIRDFAYRHSI
jgi:hypothetical protein